MDYQTNQQNQPKTPQIQQNHKKSSNKSNILLIFSIIVIILASTFLLTASIKEINSLNARIIKLEADQEDNLAAIKILSGRIQKLEDLH